MKLTVVVELVEGYDGVSRGAWINGDYIFDFQLDDVIRDYMKEGYKIVYKIKGGAKC